MLSRVMVDNAYTDHDSQQLLHDLQNHNNTGITVNPPDPIPEIHKVSYRRETYKPPLPKKINEE